MPEGLDEAPVVKDRPDWILNSIDGKTEDIEKIYKDGLKIADFDIADKDKYWNRDDVKKSFSTPEGEEDYDAFSKSYDIQRDKFLKLRQA